MASKLESMNEESNEIKARLNSLLRNHHDNEENKKISCKVTKVLKKYESSIFIKLFSINKSLINLISYSFLYLRRHFMKVFIQVA